jgi:hypothetical protein
MHELEKLGWSRPKKRSDHGARNVLRAAINVALPLTLVVVGQAEIAHKRIAPGILCVGFRTNRAAAGTWKESLCSRDSFPGH